MPLPGWHLWKYRSIIDNVVAVSEIRFVPRGWIIKTSSGALARSANRKKHLAEMETRA